ncbi:RNA-binding protein [Candidatus Bathyarchaeota archaeon]|nr:MAG: RNA-binding protein [Candidatus Bathyarchaeota archaeon]
MAVIVQLSHPLKRQIKISIAIPASFTSDIPHLREKTLRIGLIGRALAIFRIDEALIYPDLLSKDQTGDADLIKMILSYMETPQYLRKRLFKIRPELRYVGILPPLRTPHHPTQNREKDLKIGEHREGVVISTSKKGAYIDIGVERPLLAPGVRMKVNSRVTVVIRRKGRELVGEVMSPDKVKFYWGYRIKKSNSPLGSILKNREYDLVIATSRRGDPVMEVADRLLSRWKRSNKVLVAFGSPTQGLQEIVKQENIRLEDVADFIINMIPNQGVETVRTEEAIYATLAVLNILAL